MWTMPKISLNDVGVTFTDLPILVLCTARPELYERHAAKILRFCRARLSPQEAEDAVQHTFLNAYRSLRAGTVPRAEASWLFAIAENVCRERRRSAWRRSRNSTCAAR